MLLLNTLIVPKNKTLFVLFVYYVYFLCVSLVSFFYNKDKFMSLWSSIHHSFVYLCYLERLCLYNKDISLAAMLRQLEK